METSEKTVICLNEIYPIENKPQLPKILRLVTFWLPFSPGVMLNFLLVPSFFIRVISIKVSGIVINIGIGGLWVKQLPCRMWGSALCNQLEDIIEQRLTSPEQEGILPAGSLGTQPALLPWVSCLLPNLQTLDLPSLHDWLCKTIP